MTGRAHAVVIVLDHDLTDTETAMLRNGLLMYRGVTRVIPVEGPGIPNDHDAEDAVRRDVMREGYADLRSAQETRDDYGDRIRRALEALTGDGPQVPAPRGAERAHPTWQRSPAVLAATDEAGSV